MNSLINNPSSCWEYGSERAWYSPNFIKSPFTHPWSLSDCLYLSSGRDALNLFIRYSIQSLSVTRIFIPAYYCQEVVRSLTFHNIEVCIL